jgi:hypothetical protein
VDVTEASPARRRLLWAPGLFGACSFNLFHNNSELACLFVAVVAVEVRRLLLKAVPPRVLTLRVGGVGAAYDASSTAAAAAAV